jgi:hypothetical protein
MKYFPRNACELRAVTNYEIAADRVRIEGVQNERTKKENLAKLEQREGQHLSGGLHISANLAKILCFL